jgi:hypothetical protein
MLLESQLLATNTNCRKLYACHNCSHSDFPQIQNLQHTELLQAQCIKAEKQRRKETGHARKNDAAVAAAAAAVTAKPVHLAPGNNNVLAIFQSIVGSY